MVIVFSLGGKTISLSYLLLLSHGVNSGMTDIIDHQSTEPTINQHQPQPSNLIQPTPTSTIQPDPTNDSNHVTLHQALQADSKTSLIVKYIQSADLGAKYGGNISDYELRPLALRLEDAMDGAVCCVCVLFLMSKF